MCLQFASPLSVRQAWSEGYMERGRERERAWPFIDTKVHQSMLQDVASPSRCLNDLNGLECSNQ